MDKMTWMTFYQCSRAVTIIYLIPYDTRIVFDAQYLHCKSSLYLAKTADYILNKITVIILKSRNNVKNEPSCRQSILQKFDNYNNNIYLYTGYKMGTQNKLFAANSACDKHEQSKSQLD